jgi:hypothetical protein
MHIKVENTTSNEHFNLNRLYLAIFEHKKGVILIFIKSLIFISIWKQETYKRNT